MRIGEELLKFLDICANLRQHWRRWSKTNVTNDAGLTGPKKIRPELDSSDSSK